MPLNFMRRLSGRHRTPRANKQLGGFLALIAGAVNAGGFLAVHQYTSHMSGFVSSVADNLVLGNMLLMLAGLGSILSFLAGAACTAVLINWARHRDLQAEYALSLVAEAVLLLLFGFLGAHLEIYMAVTVPLTVILLCFIMGLQNAIMSKMSNAEIRTTHLTGVITDLGIELGRMLYWNRTHGKDAPGYVGARKPKLAMLIGILAMFFAGGIIGALGFKHIGFSVVLPFAFALLAVALMPMLDDAVAHYRALRR
ncbi:MAG TPA: YoaK family protein [Oxalicibacterium sp.]